MENELSFKVLNKSAQIKKNMIKKNKRKLVKTYGKDAEKVVVGKAINAAKKSVEMEENTYKTRIKELVRKALMQEMDVEVGADRYEGEQELSQASAMMDKLESLLKGFDWYYYMSDDNRSFLAGSLYDKKIGSIVKQLVDLGYGEDAKKLYNQYAPDDKLKMKEAKKAEKDYDGDGTIESSEEEYKGSRDKAIKKAKGEVKEDNLGHNEIYSIQREGRFWIVTWRTMDGKKEKVFQSEDEARKFASTLNEDLDLGHTDNEPHMIKGELYQIGKYSMALYSIMEELEERGGEIDLPAWWQSKITTAKNMISSAKHYLEFELAEPKVDAFIDRVTGEEPHEGEPPMMVEADKDKESLMYALATNLGKYGRPQSKSSDKPAKLTKGLEKGREKYVKKLKKHMSETISEKILKQLKNPNA